jgi:hypothetical protein
MHAPPNSLRPTACPGPGVPVTAGLADDDTCQRQWLPADYFREQPRARLRRLPMRSRSCLALWALSAVAARFGRIRERLDAGVLMSPVLLAERQAWATPLLRSTWVHMSWRNSPGRRPSVTDSAT